MRLALGIMVTQDADLDQRGTAVSDVREVANAVRNDLVRRRELNAMLKPALISYVITLENDLHALTQRIEASGDAL